MSHKRERGLIFRKNIELNTDCFFAKKMVDAGKKKRFCEWFKEFDASLCKSRSMSNMQMYDTNLWERRMTRQEAKNYFNRGTRVVKPNCSVKRFIPKCSKSSTTYARRRRRSPTPVRKRRSPTPVRRRQRRRSPTRSRSLSREECLRRGYSGSSRKGGCYNETRGSGRYRNVVRDVHYSYDEVMRGVGADRRRRRR